MADTSLWVVGGGSGTTTSISFSPFPLSFTNQIPAAQLQATDNGQFSATVQLKTLANNTGSPTSASLQVRQAWSTDGTTAFPSMPNLPATGTTDLTIDAKGNVTPQTSSARFKTEIEPLCDDFSRILALEPKQFKSLMTGERGIGFVAEEVAALSLDDLVSRDDSGEPLSVNYKLVPIFLLEVLKSHERTIRALQEEITALQERAS
jgi:hypothetical protein